MHASYYAFVSRGPDGLYRAAFPDLSGVVGLPVRAGGIDAAAADALAAHLRTRRTPLPPPTPLAVLAQLHHPDDGYWLAVPVLR